MKYQIGDLVIGKVTNVKPYAIFLEFDDHVQGLLHISEISDAYVRDIEKYGSVGDEIKVKVLSIDKSNGFLRVSLKQVPQEEAYTTHTNNGHKNSKATDADFSLLQEKLEGWIKETLEKTKGEKND